jgi:hypothetical protein
MSLTLKLRGDLISILVTKVKLGIGYRTEYCRECFDLTGMKYSKFGGNCMLRGAS